MLKAGIIRCQQTEDMCPADADFKAAREGAGSFKKQGQLKLSDLLPVADVPAKGLFLGQNSWLSAVPR